jgi:hypothetical protein
MNESLKPDFYIMSKGLFSMPITLPGTKFLQALQVGGTHFYRHDACIHTLRIVQEGLESILQLWRSSVFIIIMMQIY